MSTSQFWHCRSIPHIDFYSGFCLSYFSSSCLFSKHFTNACIFLAQDFSILRKGNEYMKLQVLSVRLHQKMEHNDASWGSIWIFTVTVLESIHSLTSVQIVFASKSVHAGWGLMTKPVKRFWIFSDGRKKKRTLNWIKKNSGNNLFTLSRNIKNFTFCKLSLLHLYHLLFIWIVPY